MRKLDRNLLLGTFFLWKGNWNFK